MDITINLTPLGLVVTRGGHNLAMDMRQTVLLDRILETRYKQLKHSIDTFSKGGDSTAQYSALRFFRRVEDCKHRYLNRNAQDTRFQINYDSIIDKYYYVEAADILNSGNHNYIYAYSVGDMMEYILAIAFADEPENIREKIQKRCSEANIDYTAYMYALASNDSDFLSATDPNILIKCSPQIEEYIYEYCVKHKCTNVEEQVTQVIFEKIYSVCDYLFRVILSELCRINKECSYKWTFTSKSLYSMLIKTEKACELPDITIRYKDLTFHLSAYRCRSVGRDNLCKLIEKGILL